MDFCQGLFLLFEVTLLVSTSATQDASSDSLPHIVFMMVDDWGWANVGYHRDPPTKEVDTPNFDSLKQQGLELDQHYVYQFCSPSRSSFLSGRLPIHVNDENKQMSSYNPDDPISGFAGIPRNMTAIATKLKSAGYATHQVGKWHAGAATSDHIPTGRGFDSSFGYFNFANDYFTEIDADKCPNASIVDLWDTDKPAHGVNGTGKDSYEEDLFHSRAIKVIENHDATSPLFLYYAAHIAHGPLEITDKYLNMYSFINDTARQKYHAMIKYLDDVLGSIVDTLTTRKMWDNLLFVVSGDNGGPFGSANNFPLKGGKFSDWQGGVRVNAFVSGGYLPQKMRGQKTEGYIHIADWYSTFCALAGVDPTDKSAAEAKLPPIDSLNMWPLISGQNSTSPRVDIPVSNFTLISGDYKILTGDIQSATWGGPFSPNTTANPGRYTIAHCGEGCLYNIIEDPTEHHNLAESNPAKLKEMQNKLAQYQATHFHPDRGRKWPGACTAALDQYGGFWGPYVS